MVHADTPRSVTFLSTQLTLLGTPPESNIGHAGRPTSTVFQFFDGCTRPHRASVTGTTIGAGMDMTTSLPLRIVRVVSVPVFLVMMAAPTWAQETTGFAKNGGYVGMSGILDFSFGGDTFDGESIYKKVNGEEILILPKFDGAHHALRAVFGWRTGIGAFEVSYDRSKHQGTFMEFPGEATFHAVNFDERIFLLRERRIQPHVLLGGSIPWMTIQDGSYLDPEVGDGSFRGYGINTEAGVTVFPHPRFGISTGYRYRIMWFDTASGVTHTTYQLRPRFHETTGSVVITGTFTF